ncbi:MAG: hypothetical protein H0W25_21020, partial [Acidimicrobiia bacterium]|nr:hypothetical protein [Acidimicrobiia bacterium]
MRIGIAKPEWGFRGGFEFVLDRIVDQLSAAGHDVVWLTIDAAAAGQPPHAAFGMAIPDDVWANAVEYFRYLTMVERFGALDASGTDVLLCTQPGSWAVEHPRKLALFYHHLRVFYDLAETYVDAGFSDPVFHDPCTAEVRSLDAPLIDGVRHFLTPSGEVDARLATFNGIGADRRSPFLAGFAFRDGRGVAARPSDGTGHVLSVSRHEWPKRTELVVATAHHLRAAGVEVEVKVVGGGGRLEHAKA